MNIYLAGPLFTAAELAFNQDLASMLRCEGHEVYLPQEHQKGTMGVVFRRNVERLRWADAVVAVLDGADVDSGTAWECGFAYASSKPVFGFRTDSRIFGLGGEIINLQVREAVTLLHKATDLLRSVRQAG